jgi:hypothetical protein
LGWPEASIMPIASSQSVTVPRIVGGFCEVYPNG